MPLSRSTTKTIKLLMIGTIFGFILANLLIFVDSFLLSQNPETFLLKYKERVRSDDTQLDILKSRTRNKNVSDKIYLFNIVFLNIKLYKINN